MVGCDKSSVDNIVWQTMSVSKAERVAIKHPKAACVWLTVRLGQVHSCGLAQNAPESLERYTYLLDSDNSDMD